ncbi:DUF421 domain-containing protein [Alteromonas ponticola]|uniref:DUF421 domain-containing protein n=1 Tax=Alteromonas aquimaris TaxID=2998417 RepID=A0ABT3P9X4_9ALTE|nr:YetF domain-containing protein [Alteromonas aquimaris]MCW8109577.1 DUF421 domain-containing protein [Alteromonas aquimaris]
MFVSDTIVEVLLRGTVLTTLAMLWVVLLVRVNGLRSFSKMTNFDFVMTIAVGSLLANTSQSTSWESFFQSLIALASLFLVQYCSARLRKSSDTAESIMQNQPVILMLDGEILYPALEKTRVAESDLYAKLREANVLDEKDVRAVVLETTGDISVLHGSTCSKTILKGTKVVG